MSQTLVIRSAAPPCSPTMPITLISVEPISELTSYLSGNLADYRLVSSAPGEVVITPINSYKERYRRMKTELSNTVEKVNKMEEERMTLRRAQVYSTISSEVNKIWFARLPEDVQSTLTKFGKTHLPSTFASWWLQWEEAFPDDFPLPPSMRHFGPIKKLPHPPACFIFDSKRQESCLSQAITSAWEAVPETSRQLMLFCWSRLRTLGWNEIAHPDMDNSSAKAILKQDFKGNFKGLHAAAGFMADYLFYI